MAPPPFLCVFTVLRRPTPSAKENSSPTPPPLLLNPSSYNEVFFFGSSAFPTEAPQFISFIPGILPAPAGTRRDTSHPLQGQPANLSLFNTAFYDFLRLFLRRKPHSTFSLLNENFTPHATGSPGPAMGHPPINKVSSVVFWGQFCIPLKCEVTGHRSILFRPTSLRPALYSTHFLIKFFFWRFRSPVRSFRTVYTFSVLGNNLILIASGPRKMCSNTTSYRLRAPLRTF